MALLRKEPVRAREAFGHVFFFSATSELKARSLDRHLTAGYRKELERREFHVSHLRQHSCLSCNATWRLGRGLPSKLLGSACRFHELAKVLFQTREAEGTENTSVPSIHTAEEALRELVKGQFQRQRLYAAAGCDATSMKNFDMPSSMRVKFFSWRDVLFVA